MAIRVCHDRYFATPPNPQLDSLSMSESSILLVSLPFSFSLTIALRAMFHLFLVYFFKIFASLTEQAIDCLVPIFSGPIPRFSSFIVDRCPDQPKFVFWCLHKPSWMLFEVCHLFLPS